MAHCIVLHNLCLCLCHFPYFAFSLLCEFVAGHRELIETLTKIRDEEQEHHDTGLEEEAEKWPLYAPTVAIVKTGCKAAIWLSERVQQTAYFSNT